MAATLKLGNKIWATKEGSLLGYNNENNNYKPLPFNFTRASSATRVNKQGLIETVASGVPRIDYTDANGALKLEPQRTNLITQSEALDNAYWTKTGSSVVSGFASPDGTLNSYTLTEDTSNGQHKIDPQNISVTNGSDYTCSIFAKKGLRDVLQMVWSGAFGSSYVNFDLTNATFQASGSVTGKIETFANGWYKCTITQAAAATGLGRCQILLQDNISATRFGSYQGNGSGNIFIAFAQSELGSYATSYIPTQGATATRVAEICNGAGNNQVFNDIEGTLFLHFKAFENDLSNRRISLSDGTANNSIRILYYNDGGTVFFRKYVGGVQTSIVTINSINQHEMTKIAIKYNSTNFDIFANGVKISTNLDSNSFPTNTLNRFGFADGSGSGTPFYGNTKQIQYFNTALSDAELQALTTL
jgi:hypothetical protein